jgi:hypothetical protein
MQGSRLWLFGLLFSSFFFGRSAEALIFGPDDREVALRNPSRAKIARATAIMISPVFYSENLSSTLDLDLQLISDPEGFNLCKEERFALEPHVDVSCTGFLVAPNLLVTAGHCMVNHGVSRDERNAHCESFSWLFDFVADANGVTRTRGVPKENLFHCRRVVYAELDYDYDRVRDMYSYRRDIAIVELDRPAVGRDALPIAAREARVGESLGMMGFPTGLPMKWTGNGRVTGRAGPEAMRTNLDAFGGNSGSPVLNGRGEVAGILVRGFPLDDFFIDPTGCRRPNRCDLNGRCQVDEGRYPVGIEIQALAPVRQFIPTR